MPFCMGEYWYANINGKRIQFESYDAAVEYMKNES